MQKSSFLCYEASLRHDVKHTTMSMKKQCKTCVAEDQGAYVSQKTISLQKSIKQRRYMVSRNYGEINPFV